VQLITSELQAFKTFITDPFFAFHIANGFEEDGQLHMDFGYVMQLDQVYNNPLFNQ